jgi:hypothetical protein
MSLALIYLGRISAFHKHIAHSTGETPATEWPMVAGLVAFDLEQRLHDAAARQAA